MEQADALPPEQILSHWDLTPDSVERRGAGLINRTFFVAAAGRRFVLARLGAIFSPVIHENIRAVTERLAAAGLPTPRLVPTATGALWLNLGPGGSWRLMTFVDGVSCDVVRTPAQAAAAGSLLARFHRALEGLSHVFLGMRPGVHDTQLHLERLRKAIAGHVAHRLHAPVQDLAAEIFDAAETLPRLPDLPPRVCHGDPKLNNVLFAGIDPPSSERAICLIDLDTVGPMPLALELGDAWRSWCNRSGEDAPRAELDLGVFQACVDGYVDVSGPLAPDDATALLHSIEWLSLELAARFAADALAETYFGWDPSRFSGLGEHNLARAQGQWSLHRALLANRPERARLLGR